MLGQNLFGGRAFEAHLAELKRQALLEIAGGHADGIEALDQPQGALHINGRQFPIAAISSNDATR